MIFVRITAPRLVKNPGGPNHRLGRGLVAGRVPQEASLELVGAEEPLYTCVIVHDQGTHEMPVPRFVKAEDPVAQGREAEAIKPKPTVAIGGHTTRVPRKK